MSDRAHEDSGQGMLLIEAVEALKSSWNTGESSLSEIGSQLRGPTRLSSLLQLVKIDCQLALEAGHNYEAQRYIELFPELLPHRSVVEQYVRESRAAITPLEADTSNVDSLGGMFSKASIAPTLDHVSDGGNPRHVNPKTVPADAAESDIPRMIGSYRILREIGRGSFGKVYLALDTRLNREVAIKIQDKQHGQTGLSDAFLHEARAISRLEHPNIVRLFHVDETDQGLGYLVYEFVAGKTLADRVKLANYSIADAVRWIAAIARALDYAHRRGVVHRDISPRNIMIDQDGTAKLLDFGLSRLDDSFHVADENQLLGTPNFMSPEQASGKPHWATSHADIFSLGCVLYYVLAGKVPFQGSSIFDICERVQSAVPPPLRSLRQGISAELETVVARAMAKEPQSRYPSGADFAVALERATMRHDKAARTPAQGNNLFARAIALVMVCIGTGFLWLAWKQYEAALPQPKIDSIALNVTRGDQSARDILGEDMNQLLPLQSDDNFALSWEATGSLKPTVAVFSPSTKEVTVFHPSTNFCPLPRQEVPMGTAFVFLCLAKQEISRNTFMQLPSPFASDSSPAPMHVVYTSHKAPKIKGADERSAPQRSNRTKDFEIEEEFKKGVIELGVKAFFGVVIQRDQR